MKQRLSGSIDRPLSYDLFRGQRESFLHLSTVDYSLRDIFTQRRSMFESVSRASAGQPNIFKIRMTIDQKISIGGVFILADPRFNERRLLQIGETMNQITAHFIQYVFRYFTFFVVRIERRTMAIESDFDPSILEVGETINFASEIDPNGHLRRAESGVAGRSPEEKDFLACGVDPFAQ